MPPTRSSTVLSFCVRSRRSRGESRGFGFMRFGAKGRLIAALLAVASGVACGGGGANSGKPRVGMHLSASSLTFANQSVGSSSAAQSVTVTNTGILDLDFSSVSLTGANSGDFTKSSDTCGGAAILPNSTCTIEIKFTPSAVGSRSATLSIADNAAGSPQTVSLSGTGAEPSVGLSSAVLSFAAQQLNTPSAPQTETITNSGNSNLTISTVTLGGANAASFTKTADTCTGSTVTPNNTCSVSIAFAPLVGGSFAAILTFADNAPTSPQVVTLSGVGDAPVATLSSATLTFSDQRLTTTSAPMPVTVTNTGVENLLIATATIGGANAADFAKSADTCTGATVTPNNVCTVSLTFTPAATGSRSASMSFSDNTSTSPQVVSITGMGTEPAVSLSTSTVTFSHQNQGTTSTAQIVTVTNSGTGSLNLSMVAIGGANAADFGKSADTCTGATVAAGSVCTVNVTFTPPATATYNASLKFTDDASTSPQTVGLTGTGTASAAGISPPSLAFSAQNVGTTSAVQPVTITNTGMANLILGAVAIGGTNPGDFGKNADTCTGATIMPNGTCTVSVTFTPAAAGSRSASLTFTDNAADTPQSVGLGGTGATPAIALTPNFGALAPGNTLQFGAVMGGVPTAGVTWSVNGTPGGSAGVGLITAGGLYTAPPTTSALVVTVQATLTSNTSLVASASVAVIPPGTVTTTNNPQVAQYSMNLPPTSTVSIQFGLDNNYGLNTWTQTAPSGGGQVQILVAGMRGFTTYHMRAVVQFPDGTQYNDPDQVFTTGGLAPNQIPTMTATTTPGMTPSSGIELLDLLYAAPVGTAEYLVATDLSGNVIWYYDPGNIGVIPNPIKLLPDGNMLINYSNANVDGADSIMREVDLAGNVVWQMTAAQLNTALAAAGYNLTVQGTHHDVAILPNGHLVVIASEVQNFTDLPGYPGTTAVTGDVLIDLDTNRKPVWVWSEFDHLDVNRHPMSFPDWTHTNAILYSPSDGNLVISVRHQFWLIKIDYNNGQGAGDIIWKLGWQGDFTLQGGTDPVDWFYAQHGPGFASNTTSGDYQMIVFDNGDDRPNVANNGMPCGTIPGSPCYSRVPELEINEPALTATINWEDTLNLFSFFGGNAEVLPNGNNEFDECDSGGAKSAASIYEVTHDTPPQTVWQLQVTGQFAYRGKRMPSLYPGVQW